MEKNQTSVGDLIVPVVPTTSLPFIDLSYDDLKEISKAITRINKFLDEERQRLGPGSYVNHKARLVGEHIDALSKAGKLAGLGGSVLKNLVLSDDFCRFKQELKDELKRYKNECRDPEQPVITFYAVGDRSVKSKLENWIPKLYSLESGRKLHSGLNAKTAPVVWDTVFCF